MSKIVFNEQQIRQLELNPNVASVSDCDIQMGKDLHKSFVKTDLI